MQGDIWAIYGVPVLLPPLAKVTWKMFPWGWGDGSFSGSMLAPHA